jgi:hypothetical protein
MPSEQNTQGYLELTEVTFGSSEYDKKNNKQNCKKH